MLSSEKLNEECQNAIEWVKQYVKSSRAKGAILGVSGGKDSAVVLAMLVKAIGKENVIGVAMPCNSIKADLADAELVANTFGIRLITVNLTDTYMEMEKEINDSLNTQYSEYIQDNQNDGLSKDNNNSQLSLNNIISQDNTIRLNNNNQIVLNEEAKINIKPRLRMTVLYAIAQSMRLSGCRNWKFM